MANPLYSSFGNMNNPYSKLIQQARELSKSVPDPKAEVQRLLNSGQISQADFNSAVQMAKQVLPYIK